MKLLQNHSFYCDIYPPDEEDDEDSDELDDIEEIY